MTERKPRGRMDRFWIACSAVAIAATTAAASESQPTLDELLEIVPDREPVLRPATPGVERDVKDRLLGAEVSGNLEAALRDMDKASDELVRRRNAGAKTQRLQESALARLDALIAEAKRQCSACSGGSGTPEQRKPEIGSRANAAQASAGKSQGSTPNSGVFSPGRVGPVAPNAAPLNESRTEWGNLPERFREQLIQGMNERFSLIYKSLTEAYYRRLADEEQP